MKQFDLAALSDQDTEILSVVIGSRSDAIDLAHGQPNAAILFQEGR